MIYLTSGIIDQYDNPKVDLECIVTKAYSHDILRNITDFAMNLINTSVTVAGHPAGFDVRDAIQLQFNEPSATLKNYTGQIGTQQAMVQSVFNHCNFIDDINFLMDMIFLSNVYFAGTFRAQYKRLPGF